MPGSSGRSRELGSPSYARVIPSASGKGAQWWATRDTPDKAIGLIVPVYVYRRDDGSTFEAEQRMTADPLLSCPTTGRGVERVLQPFTPRYNGTGFYSTDHRKPAGGKASEGAGRRGLSMPEGRPR